MALETRCNSSEIWLQWSLFPCIHSQTLIHVQIENKSQVESTICRMEQLWWKSIQLGLEAADSVCYQVVHVVRTVNRQWLHCLRISGIVRSPRTVAMLADKSQGQIMDVNTHCNLPPFIQHIYWHNIKPSTSMGFLQQKGRHHSLIPIINWPIPLNSHCQMECKSCNYQISQKQIIFESFCVSEVWSELETPNRCLALHLFSFQILEVLSLFGSWALLITSLRIRASRNFWGEMECVVGVMIIPVSNKAIK